MKNRWITIRDELDLPPEGKYIIARHNRTTWKDRNDQENVNVVIVKLVKGLSKKDRELLKLSPNKEDNERAITYMRGDEHDNNKKNYCWKTFGSTSFWGQEIVEYMLIPEKNNLNNNLYNRFKGLEDTFYIPENIYINTECEHKKCLECRGTGRKENGTNCLHYISCSCEKCTPTYLN